jgi:hypothetical protein
MSNKKISIRIKKFLILVLDLKKNNSQTFMSEETSKHYESGFNDEKRNDRIPNELDTTDVGFFTEEIDTNLAVVDNDEDEQRRIETRRNLAKKIENGSGDYNIVYDVI